MGLFEDAFSAMPELQRLAAMTKEEHLLPDIGAEEWPLAILACSLANAENPEQLQHTLLVYRAFNKKVAAKQRAASLKQLQKFLTQRKGSGWRALIPYALGDTEPLIRRQAALLIATMAEPEEDERFAGVSELCYMLQRSNKELTHTSLLDALLSLSDLRFESYLEPLFKIETAELKKHLNNLCCKPNRLCLNWLLSCLNKFPDLKNEVHTAMCACAKQGGLVIDVVLPIPSWAFQKAQPQPLHGWTLAEYYPRMLPQLHHHMSEQQLEQLRLICQG